MLFSGSAETVNFSKNPDNKLEIIPPGSFLKSVFFLGDVSGRWCIILLVGGG
ncbi:MAG: hypothetical protein ISP61_02600 [Flavobacteriaceae bacterium]|nr:hypothetical protein [Flavobacteriaceae bacterium]